MPPEKTVVTAAWLVSIATPPIRDAAIVLCGDRILAVGPTKKILSEHPDARVQDAGNSVILPGLVNAHTHLELTDCQPGPPPTTGFAGWLVGMLQRTRIAPDQMTQAVTRAVADGVMQCLKFGVTTIGDISRQCHLTRPLLNRTPLRVVSYGEIQAMAQRRPLLEERLAIATDQTDATDRLTVGLTPHAPYSIEPLGYRRCLEIARAHNMPLATHLAETPDESPFLANHIGPLRDLWDAWLTWDDQVPTFVGGPIRFAQSLGLLDYPTLLAHVNYCDDDELKILANGKASIVYCPRTHAYFNHPPHRWRDMLAAGINVAIGTDSCASSPDLNLADDLRLLHRLYPEVEISNLWQLATINAARAINQQNSIGSLEPGKQADLTLFPVTTEDPLREILESSVRPVQVWLAGKPIPIAS